jgi:hypothetical protein
MYIVRCAQSKANHVCHRGVDKRGLNSWCSRNALPEKDGAGAARCPSCSQNAHDKNVLVRCAQ